MAEPFLHPDAAQELTQAILARTSGSPCQRLHSLACAFVDGELENGPSSLVRSHLETCPGCAALIRALATSHTILPRLAHLEPGPWFAQRVLRATVHQTERHSTWWKLMHRPRIALEAAYLGAAAGLMGINLPLPSPHLTTRVPALVQPFSASVQRVVEKVAQAERRTTTSLHQGLVARALTPPVAVPSKSLWQRLSTPVKERLQRFRKAPQPVAKMEEKTSKSANP